LQLINDGHAKSYPLLFVSLAALLKYVFQRAKTYRKFPAFRLKLIFVESLQSPRFMKQRCGSQSAFVNLRVLIGLFIVLAGASLALLGSGALAASSPSFVKTQQKYSALNYGGDPLVLRDLTVPKFTSSALTSKRAFGLAPS
jgi:hypothetical protein